ncbi:MAG TPA: hypothetical protein VIM18_02995 [Solirubrobacteraceae bacterium]|jgi:hypothetical protein
MLTRPLHHLRDNLVAYLALFVALGGTSYAALTISGSQIRNHSIEAVKLNPRSIAASIKAWANVQWTVKGLVAQGSNGPVRVLSNDQGEQVIWTRQRFPGKCIASATPQFNANGEGFNGYVNTQLLSGGRSVFLRGFGPDGSHRPQAAFVMIICP